MRTQLLLVLPLLACRGPATEPAAAEPAKPEPTAAPTALPGVPAPFAKILPEDAGAPTLANVRNLDRVPSLGKRHRELLEQHGFFIAPQPPPSKGDDEASARESRRAKHLFQVYERNDYIRLPSYVTADLAIDLTHQYFDLVLRDVEAKYLVPELRTALRGFLAEAQALRKAAHTEPARVAAHEAMVFWGTALRLLDVPAAGDAPEEMVVRTPYDDEEGMEKPAAPPAPAASPIPKDIAAEVDKLVKRVHAHAAREKLPHWGLEIDLTQTHPRGHYTGTGVLQRYFRSMSFLGQATFPLTTDEAKPDVVIALALSYRGASAASKALGRLRGITDFAVGEPPTAGLDRAAAAIPAKSGLDAALGADRAMILKAWGEFPQHPVLEQGPVVAPIGQRVFSDTLALATALPILRDLSGDRTKLVAAAMGAAGAAAVLGDEAGLDALVQAGGDRGADLRKAFVRGREIWDRRPARDDAYHGTLAALDAWLGAEPLWFDAEAWQLRRLQSFGGGWAMLRHDTILYGYQLGAECDAEDFPPPYAFVEPVPEVYAALRKMVETFSKRLREGGIKEEPSEDSYMASYTLDQKAQAIGELLTKLEQWSKQELDGVPFDEATLTELTTLGGYAEHVLLTIAGVEYLTEGNDDMAVVADVFTFQDSALEVAVGHPDLVYALIPTPKGWQVARGAVLAYRELWAPTSDRMTDDAWRARLTAGTDFAVADRPSWLDPISAPPVAVVRLPEGLEGQDRCGYSGSQYGL